MSEAISVKELAHRIETDPTLQLIDVRSSGEYSTGHVPRAMNIPLEQVETRLDDLGRGPIAILCQSGRRAGMACELLGAHRRNLLLVEGGTGAWIEAGFPVTTSTPSRWSLERQVRLIAGLLVLLGTLLSLLVSQAWIGLAIFIGAGLTFAGLTNICGMAAILALLPWNRPKAGLRKPKEVIA